MTKVIHISLTGHRPKKLGGYNLAHKGYIQLQRDLENFIAIKLEEFDVVIGHGGLALGADTIWAKAILAMREKYPGRVKFHAEIPMMTQSSVWFNKKDIDFWHVQVNTADYKTVYGDILQYPENQRKRMSGKILNDRNDGMLNACDILLALWDGSSGGTGNAVNYAEKNDIDVSIVHPNVYF